MVRETEISTQFGFAIYEMQPMKGVYLIKTNKGNKCLKKVNYGTQKITYIYKAKESIAKRGFDRIDRNMLTVDGMPYALVNDDIYVVTDWIEGRESDFKKDDEIKNAAATLAEFHTYARKFEGFEARERNDIGKLKETLEKRMYTLSKMRDMARKNRKKTEFDRLYLSNIDYYMEMAQEALNLFNEDSYSNVCIKAVEDNVLCHHDYTYHNILVDKENKMHIVDFDYAKSEIQIYDLSTLLIKALKRQDWKIECGKAIVDSYRGVKELTDDEINVLRCMLNFPQRFWRLANRYYYREAGWSEEAFTKKLKEIISERPKYVEFVKNVNEIF